MTVNTAAWLRSPRTPLSTGPADVPGPAAGELVVRVAAVAINPLDWIVQGAGQLTYRWLRYPAVLGTDVVGEVVEVGAGVTRFVAGERVVGLATGTDRGRDPRREGAFQRFTVLAEQLVSPVPAHLDDAHAAVLPLAVSTAACALFQPKHLGLALPGSAAPHAGGVVLVWGGSTSVGANAVQLARAAGYDVISTASPKNFELVRSFGAEAVVDYRSPTAVDDLVAAAGGRTVVGAVALGAGSGEACLAVLRRTGGAPLALCTPAVTLEGVASAPRLLPAALPVMLRLVTRTGALMVRARRAGVRAAFVWGSSLRDDAVGPAIWRDFLPTALARGTFRAVPEPQVVGHGLEAVQEAIDRQRRGVSATKLVVTI